MKKFTLLAIILLIAASFNLRAQNTDYRWAFGINWQFEDFNTVHLSFPDQFKYTKWQGYKFPSALSISRNLNPSFNVFAQFGVSQLEKDRMASINQPLSDDKFWTGDLNIAYKFANGYILKEQCWFDPYIYLGIGASSIKDLDATNGTTYLKQVTGVGFNFWLTENVGLNFQGAYDYIITPKVVTPTTTEAKRDDYMHYTMGVKIRFGAKDTDGDGVKDKDDLCPETPGKVELQGCPDKDNDGIADKDDACPDVAGKPEFKGCPDTDGDGIIDSEDACPTVAGKKELNGCPDKDGDGIADKDDKCPDVAGLKALAGCPDRDGDGIADNDDACPDVKGLAQFKGCPDTDGDGIADKDDKCPDVFGVASNFGCPEVKKFEFYKVVYFGSDKSVMLTKYTKDLDEVVSIMKEHSDVSVSVEGYADSQGPDAYNMKLSEKRTDYVINYLVKKGVAKDRLVKKYYGEANPVGNNKTAAGRAQNRRVEIKAVN
jgi:outer membrane protein OmpA-like peptidoglycan-associated protein